MLPRMDSNHQTSRLTGDRATVAPQGTITTAILPLSNNSGNQENENDAEEGHGEGSEGGVLAVGFGENVCHANVKQEAGEKAQI